MLSLVSLFVFTKGKKLRSFLYVPTLKITSYSPAPKKLVKSLKKVKISIDILGEYVKEYHVTWYGGAVPHFLRQKL